LAPGKEVHLKYAYNIRATKVLTDAEGRVTEVHATVDRANTNKPKGKITWVAAFSAIDVELRLYDVLFKSADPMGLGADEWLGDINPESLVVKTAKADPSLNIAKPGQLSLAHNSLALFSLHFSSFFSFFFPDADPAFRLLSILSAGPSSLPSGLGCNVGCWIGGLRGPPPPLISHFPPGA